MKFNWAIKSKITTALEHSVLYWKVYNSPLHSFLLKCLAPERLERKKIEVNFYKHMFEDFNISYVFDVGANRGDKTDAFLTAGADKVLLVEADPFWAKKCAARFGRNRTVTTLSCAVTNCSGTVAFFRFQPGSYVNTLESKWVDSMQSSHNRFGAKFSVFDKVVVKASTFSELVDVYGMPDYAKIDVEGHEASIVSAMDTTPRLLSLEFNLPEYISEFEQVCHYFYTHQTQRFVCNLVLDDSKGFHLPEWLSPNAIAEHVATYNYKYFELYAKVSS